MITTPDKVETRIGTLDFKDGAPSKATLDNVYDEIESANAQRAFADTFQGASIRALHKGLQSFGVKDNEAMIFSELMDAKSVERTSPLRQPTSEIDRPNSNIQPLANARFRLIEESGFGWSQRGKQHLLKPYWDSGSIAVPGEGVKR